MAGKIGQRKGIRNPDARVNKRNVAFSDNENDAIIKSVKNKVHSLMSDRPLFAW